MMQQTADSTCMVCSGDTVTVCTLLHHTCTSALYTACLLCVQQCVMFYAALFVFPGDYHFDISKRVQSFSGLMKHR